MGRKTKKRVSFFTVMLLILNLLGNLISPISSAFAEPQPYKINFTSSMTVNGATVGTGTTVKLKAGDKVSFNLNYWVDKEQPFVEEGDKFTFTIPEVLEFSKKYNKTPAQICLKYILQLGAGILPKSKTPSRIKENFQMEGWEIEEEDINRLKSLKQYRLQDGKPFLNGKTTEQWYGEE